MEPDREALRRALREAAPWLEAPDVGPRSVDAGWCDRCGRRPRLLPTCGPHAPPALCRDCAEELGDDAWCAGHRDEGRAARHWARRLPHRWADAVVLWWIGTGELTWDPRDAPPTEGWPAPVRRALGR